MKKLFVAFVLWVISVVIVSILAGFTFVWYTLYCVFTWKVEALTKYYNNCAYSGDQTGNAYCYPTLNSWFSKGDGHKYGNPDETVSSAMGQNEKLSNLSKFGAFIGRILDWLDPGHMKKSIEKRP